MLKSTLFCIFIFTINICCAQDHKEIEATINALEQKGVKGILASDSNMLKPLWAPEFMVNTPRNNIAENRSAVFKIQQAGMIDYRSYEKEIEKMQIHDNIVVTMGSETYVPNVDLPGGVKAGETVKRRFTNVWMKQNGQWLQIARHASIICK